MEKNVPEIVQKIRDYCQSSPKLEDESKSISFSQLSVFLNCNRCWERMYLRKEIANLPSIYTVFGTAVHETLQTWLDVLYNKSGLESDEMDLSELLANRLREIYSTEKAALGKDFTTLEELEQFYQQGVKIVTHVQMHRRTYFSTNKRWLVGCEIPLIVKLRGRVFFKGFIDALLYDEERDKWIIMDFKTSTVGWNTRTTEDFVKTSQLLLYKNFLSEQFGIPLDKIFVEYFIVRRVVENRYGPFPLKRVQEFSPTQEENSVKKAVEQVTSFLDTVLAEDGSYIDREYQKSESSKNCKYCVFKDTCIEKKTRKKKKV